MVSYFMEARRPWISFWQNQMLSSEDSQGRKAAPKLGRRTWQNFLFVQGGERTIWIRKYLAKNGPKSFLSPMRLHWPFPPLRGFVCMERTYVQTIVVCPTHEQTFGPWWLPNIGFVDPLDDWAVWLWLGWTIFILFYDLLAYSFHHYLFNSYLFIYPFCYLLTFFV